MAKAWPQEFQMFTRWETRLFGFVLILLTINASAKIDSVLEVIQNTAVGLINVGNLKGFNQEVGDMIAQMDSRLILFPICIFIQTQGRM